MTVTKKLLKNGINKKFKILVCTNKNRNIKSTKHKTAHTKSTQKGK